MSLLMDALKKAEQEKKEAAKRQQESEGSPEGENVKVTSRTLDDADTWGHEIADGSTTAEIPGMQITGRHSTTAELQLEPVVTGADDTAEIPNMGVNAATSPETEAPPTLNVTMNELSLAEISRDDVDMDDVDAPEQTPASIEELQSENADLLDETFHGVLLDSTNPELFQETVQGDVFLSEDDASQTWGETLPGIPAAQLAQDIGSDDQPTPVAAQTVFAATGTTQSSALGFKWILAGLCTVFLIAATVYYYYIVTPTNRILPSPQIAQGIEQIGPALNETLKLNIQPVRGDLAGTTSGEITGTLTSEESVLAGTVIPESTLMDEQQVSQVTTEQTDIEAVETSSTDVSEEPASTETSPVDAESQGSAVIAALPETITPEPSLIKISRSKALDDKGKVIRDAYFAYQKGAYGTAVEKYQEALKEFPDNRDALLGLGAIASNNGDYESAFGLYARILKLNPGDQFARAALINLQDRSVLLNSESVVNSMLHDNPDTYFLHFTLGNIYAAGSRWAEAQQAFFDAYRLNSGNPDYALNLAISLDHTGQYGAALDYYNTALELSDNTPSRFDSSPVRKRIDDLNQVAER